MVENAQGRPELATTSVPQVERGREWFSLRRALIGAIVGATALPITIFFGLYVLTGGSYQPWDSLIGLEVATGAITGGTIGGTRI